MFTYFVDTYAWMEYFSGNPSYGPFIDNNYLKTPILVLGELSRSFTRKGLPEDKQEELLEFVKKKSYIVPLTEENVKYSGRLAEQEKLSFADAIMYSYATPIEKLLTGDNHFKGKRYVEFVK
ncbi:MAG: PIN domain-containing protein [Candidatus Micrarchaeota archaeon]